MVLAKAASWMVDATTMSVGSGSGQANTTNVTRRQPCSGRGHRVRRVALLMAAMATTAAGLLVGPLFGVPVGASPATATAATSVSTEAAPGAPASAAFTLLQGLDLDGIGAGGGTVDVLLDHRVCALRAVPYGSVSRRLSVPAGMHRLDVLASDGRCTSGVALAGADIDAASDAELTLLLHRGANGAARLSHQLVDLAPLSRCEVRLSVYNLTGVALDDVVLRHGSQGWTALELSRLDPGEGTWTTTVVDADYRLEARHGGGALQAVTAVPEGRVSTLYVVGDDPAALQVVVDTRVSRNFTG